MPGPCPNGRPTANTHKAAKCADKERCAGPGCRVRRPARVRPITPDDTDPRETIPHAA